MFDLPLFAKIILLTALAEQNNNDNLKKSPLRVMVKKNE